MVGEREGKGESLERKKKKFPNAAIEKAYIGSKLASKQRLFLSDMYTAIC